MFKNKLLLGIVVACAMAPGLAAADVQIFGNLAVETGHVEMTADRVASGGAECGGCHVKPEPMIEVPADDYQVSGSPGPRLVISPTDGKPSSLVSAADIRLRSDSVLTVLKSPALTFTATHRC